MATVAQASQVAKPWKAVARTVVATAVPTLLALAYILQAFADVYKDAIPASVILWATSAAAFLILSAGFVTRIMAIPGVNEFLARFNLDAQPHNPEVIEYKPITSIPDYPNK